mmetsp:Transcript_8285/g.12850  ORF Transcript_8285/g.12850 Transcript_8285/m.12850 type:complete len:241 (+) Transcript_8285:82-804(+)
MSIVCSSTPPSSTNKMKKSPVMLTQLGFPKLGICFSTQKHTAHFTYYPKTKKDNHQTKQIDKTACKGKSVEQITMVYREIDYIPAKLDNDGICAFIGGDIACISTFVRTYNAVLDAHPERYHSHSKKKQTTPTKPHSQIVLNTSQANNSSENNGIRDDLTTSERIRLYTQIRALKNSLDSKCVEYEVLKQRLLQTEKDKNKLLNGKSLVSLRELISSNLSNKTPEQQCSFLYGIVKSSVE